MKEVDGSVCYRTHPPSPQLPPASRPVHLMLLLGPFRPGNLETKLLRVFGNSGASKGRRKKRLVAAWCLICEAVGGCGNFSGRQMLQNFADGFVCECVHSRWFNMRKESLSGRTIKGSYCTCVIQPFAPSSTVILRMKLSDALR